VKQAIVWRVEALLDALIAPPRFETHVIGVDVREALENAQAVARQEEDNTFYRVLLVKEVERCWVPE
jgi:hypothetical protein